MVFSDDPSKKWCAYCKSFLEIDKFFNRSGYCKKCQTITSRERIKNLKYIIECIVCKKSFNSYRKDAKVCGQTCRCSRSNHRRINKSYNSLSNELAEKLKNENDRPWEY